MLRRPSSGGKGGKSFAPPLRAGSLGTHHRPNSGELPASVSVPEDLVEKARVLDNFYIPSCYPNAHPEGAPFEHYGPLQSERGIQYAREIIEFIRSQMA